MSNLRITWSHLAQLKMVLLTPRRPHE